MRVIALVARLLPRDDREAVLGDQAELRTPPAGAALEVISLVAGRATLRTVTALGILLRATVYTAVILILGYWFSLHMATAE
jgi:TRAP-type C4-dicarboxylate transport system permease large subunit